ncbi:predicted protein, partial [Nematostella vectensis]
MQNRWDSLRNKFQAKNVDLDAEFEKFLNESMSDESLSSPRHKAPPLKSLKSKGTLEGASSLPWWAKEDEEEEKRSAAARQSWLKPKQAEKKDNESTRQKEGYQTDPKTPGAGLLSTDTAGEAESTALSISKDSLDERSRHKSPSTPGDSDDDRDHSNVQRNSPEQFEDTLTFSGAPPTQTAPPGLDTLQEMEEKKKFFEEEGGDKTSPDYGQKLQEFSTSKLTTDEKEKADRLQATGVEVGDSIFNVTGVHLPKFHYMEVCSNQFQIDKEISLCFIDADHTEGVTQHDDEGHYSEEFEKSQEESVDSQAAIQHHTEVESETTQQQARAPATVDPTKPSLLSKVSLMDSLDSTLDVKRSPMKRPPLPPQKDTKLQDASLPADPGMGTTGNLYSGNTETIAELQAALQQAQLNATETSEHNTGKIILPPTPTVIQSIDQDSTDLGQLVLEKASGGETKSRGFDLQPVVITDNEPVEKTLKPRPYRPNIDSVGMTLTSDTLDSASPPVDCAGFTLRPSVEARDMHQEGWAGESGAHSEDEDTPPPDSLRSIKAKARQRMSVEGSRKSTGKGGLTLRESGERVEPAVKRREPSGGKTAKVEPAVKRRETKNKDVQRKGGGDRRSVELWQPSLSSPPSWSPTPSMRKSKKKEKRQSSSRPKDADSSPQHLAASVESFANYLKHLVRPEDDQENQPPTPRWSDDEPRKSRMHVRSSSASDRLTMLSRERTLQEEAEKWQQAWKDERRRNDKLISDIAVRERDWSRAEERMRQDYEQQLSDLKQEVFSLTARLREEEQNADNRKRVAAGGKLKSVSEEEQKRLEREIREQEELLKGYQQENERLYRDLKQQQASSKATEGRMFSENQKLGTSMTQVRIPPHNCPTATEVANLKERLDQRTTAPPSRVPVPGSALLGSDRITQLQSQLSSIKERETKLRAEVDELRLVNTRLETRVRAADRERDTAVQRAEQALGATSQEREDLKLRYEDEIDRLNRKLKWYAENQQLLDHDAAALKEKDKELKELRETVSRLRAQQGSAATERRQRSAERSSDAKRIQDLQRQVKEMEEIIKRRYPNSLPALIFAAASAPGSAQPSMPETSPVKQSPSYVFLENRVKKLEKELEENDDEANKRIRAIEQKYNAMRFDYDERVKSLEQELAAANERVKLSVHPRKAHAQALEQEFAAAQAGDRRRIAELESEVGVLQDALAQASSLKAHQDKGKRKTSEPERPTSQLNKQLDGAKIEALQKQLSEKNREMLDLQQTCERLRTEKLALVPQANQTLPQAAQLEEENMRLRRRLAEQGLDMEQMRLRYCWTDV